MQKYKSNLQDASGRAIRNAPIRVISLGGEIATLYSDNGTTPISNPVVTNEQGEFSFYAPNGRYSLQIQAEGYTSESDADVIYLYDVADEPSLDGVAEDAPLAATPAWADVPSLKTASGFADAALNAQAQALLNQTAALRDSAGLPLQDYAGLRAYTGDARVVRITGVVGAAVPAGIVGTYQQDASDVTSADNGALVIVDGSGRRWKRICDPHDVDVAWFEVSGLGVIDDTAKCQEAINTGARIVRIPAWANCSVSSITLRPDQKLSIKGKLTKFGTSTSPVIVVNNGATVEGGEIDGAGVNCQGIVGSSKTRVRVSDVYLHDFGREGIASYSAGSSGWTVSGNMLKNLVGAAIVLEYTDDCTVENNRIDTAFDGIRWWGGDSAGSTTIGIRKLRIHGNSVKNVQGGIWGSLGAHITVYGNTVENCTDVGIDFEGCTDFTCTGNNAIECANGCYAVFFGSKRGSFSNNTALNSVSNGAGFYATTNDSYNNEALIISGNVFRTEGYCINAGYESSNGSAKTLSGSRITDNDMLRSGSGPAIRVVRNEKLKISNNSIVTNGSPIGIELQSVLFSRVEENELYGFGDTSTSVGDSGGVWLYAQDGSHPCQYNNVCHNRIEGYNYSIVDNCSADVTKSDNLIENNRLVNVYRRAGAGYTGIIVNNRYVYALATTIPVNSF